MEDSSQMIIDQVEKAAHSVRTDGYSMSIGEIINLYTEGDLILDPAYQRLYRWEDHQKTKLIESILIGIPIPEIFVAQNEDGTWNVVDGVQRLSSILQLFGVLDGYEPLTLDTCKYIPALEDKKLSDLPPSIQRTIRRGKLKLSIILSQSSKDAPFELFQRLNTGGSHLSPQEVRNCVILMVDTSFYEFLDRLKSHPSFLECISLKEEDYEQEEHMELIIRMFIGYNNNVDYGKYGTINKIVISDFIDQEVLALIKEGDRKQFEDDFKYTFDRLNALLGERSFHKYNQSSNKFRGGFNVSSFEMLSIGISKNSSYIRDISDEDLKNKIKEIYLNPSVQSLLGRGVRAIKRFKDINSFTIDYFQE